MAFHGIHEHTLDSKNRVTVPSKQRADLAQGVTVTVGIEPCLQVWPSPSYQQVAADTLAGVNPLTKQARDLRRHLYGHTHATDLDSAGRIMLPPAYLEHAGLSKDVVLVGNGEYFEVWAKDRWATYEPDLTQTASEHLENVGHPA